MRIFWFLIYNILIFPVLFSVTHIAALFNKKVRTGLRGRKHSLTKTRRFAEGIDHNRPLILFHCASMGEYEQIRPVLHTLGIKRPEIYRVVSFFSPSGFEFVDRGSEYDHKSYLPIDWLPTINRFLDALKPRVVVISKHDVWPNFAWALSSRKIPALLVNATMPLNSKMSWPLVRWFFRAYMGELQLLAPASEADAKGFEKILNGRAGLKILGDTRYDQVLRRVEESRTRQVIPRERFDGMRVFVAGSTWPSDEIHLLPAVKRLLGNHSNLCVILVPHEIEESHLTGLKHEFVAEGLETAFFSDPDLERKLPDARVLLVDRIGYLAELYSYGDAAYVGGSFGPGVHNVMEPAAHGIPVLFGPRILNSPDAGYLKKMNAGFQVNTNEEVYDQLENLLYQDDLRLDAGKNAANLIEENRGATDSIVAEILSRIGD